MKHIIQVVNGIDGCNCYYQNIPIWKYVVTISYCLIHKNIKIQLNKYRI